VSVEHRDAVALLDPAVPKRRREPVDPLAELGVRVSRPVDREDGLLIGVVTPRAFREVRGQQRLSHHLLL